jgi:PTH1 family peptidyl-tRNA hydrolase
MKYLIVGLGNIGSEYDMTRHNIGFDVADAFVIKHGGSFKLDRLAMVSEVKWKGKQFIVIKPTTYMNLSGKAVKYWMDKEKIKLDNIIVIVDDLAIPIEKLRIRAGGSHAGHNGLKDIDATLNTNQYKRIRFGIGNDYPRGKQADFVLSKWKSNEVDIVKIKIMHSVEAIESIAAIGLEKTMNIYNK